MTLTVINPSNGQPLSELEEDSRESAHGKLENAWTLFQNKSALMPLHERIASLESLAALMKREEAELAMLIAQEGGKPLTDARIEASRAIAGVEIAIHTMSEHQGGVVPLSHHATSAGRLAVTQKYPRGVVLAFSAFNHPLNLIVHQVVPAFATGCPCVVKPAADTPLSALKLVALMHEAGIPEDYVSAIISSDVELLGELVNSTRIAFFTFIGSSRVGWMLRQKLQPGVRCALEHGGTAPCIVTESADIETAVASLTKGGYYHAGQVCVSTQRVYVDEAIEERFTEQMSDAVRALRVGDAVLADTQVGPLIRRGEVERVASWVHEALDGGARLIVGGEGLEGHFHQPTLLHSPPDDARVTQSEVFGPVVSIYPYAHLQEALRRANIYPHAFQAAVFTQRIDDMYASYDALNASAVMINDHTAFRDDGMPFAGLDSSGLGVGGIPYTIDDMQFEKMMVLKHQQ